MPTVDNEQVKSRRDLAIERLKARYPDKEFNDDEAIFGQISDDYDELDNQLSGYKDHEEQLSQLFASDPRSAHFLSNWRNGEHPMTALVRQFGKEGLEELVNNEDKLDEFAKANEEYLERVAKEKELEEQYENNIKEAYEVIDAFQSEHGMSDEETDNVIAVLTSIAKDGLVGKISRENMELVLKGINHDAEVAAAREEGEVLGKNTKIEEQLRKSEKGDGTPTLGGKNGNGGVQRPERNLGVLGDRYGDNNKTIWERGGEKRRKA